MNVPNLRDLGGLATRDGRTVIPDLLLRSGAPRAADEPTISVTWPPSLVVDLTSPGELHRAHPLAGPSVEVVNFPLLVNLGYRAGSHTSLKDFYLDLLEFGRSDLIQLVEVVAHGRGTTLIHCAAGKDRTGLAVALLLSLLGVERANILRDYSKSANSYTEIDSRLQAIGQNGPLATPPAALTRVSNSAMTAVLKRWAAETNGAASWYLANGGQSRIVEHLRTRLLSTGANETP